MFDHIDKIFPVLLKTLSDHSDEVNDFNISYFLIFHFCSYFQVVVLDLEVLAEISSSKTGRPIEASSSPTSSNSSTSPHFKQFMLSLLKLFSADRSLLEAKGSFIIRQLCVLLSSEDIYRSISELLVLEDNLKFARLMVETLSTILLTSSELFELRTKLKVIYKLKNSFCALRTMTGSGGTYHLHLCQELGSKESCRLFCCLYQTWCHSQVSSQKQHHCE